jgi:hypothetical protein
MRAERTRRRQRLIPPFQLAPNLVLVEKAERRAAAADDDDDDDDDDEDRA